MQATNPGSQPVPTGATRVQLLFRCANLVNHHHIRTPDPYVIVELRMQGAVAKIGETEKLPGNLSPVFNTPVQIDYFFNVRQELRIVVADALSPERPVGEGYCTLADIIASRGPYGVGLLDSNRNPAGGMQIIYQRTGRASRSFAIQISCNGVKNVEFFSKSDPFLRISRGATADTIGKDPKTLQERDWVYLYKTEPKKNDLNPVFPEFNMNSIELCQENPATPLKIELMDYDSSKSHKLIGTAFTSVQRILGGERVLQAFTPDGKPAGTINLLKFNEVKNVEMTDYISSGLQINVGMAVDFTTSNGNLNDPNGLHFLDPSGKNNQYQEAITQVGKALIPYDTDKQIAALGFGAAFNGKALPSFFLSGNTQNNPNVQSWEGVLAAYKTFVPHATLSGPNNFTPVINLIKEQAQGAVKLGTNNYYVLLILTSGQINDIDDTIKAIVDCSALPMSILILGVGNGPWDGMKRLDSDDGVLRAKTGEPAKRDIVSFVAFNEVKQNDYKLGEKLLKPLPAQINHYYQSIGRVPPV